MVAKPSAEGAWRPRPEATRLRNERIAYAARAHRFEHLVPVPFLCECSEERCEMLVRLTLAEYARVRDACDYLTSPGHQVDEARITRVKDGVWLYREPRTAQ